MNKQVLDIPVLNEKLFAQLQTLPQNPLRTSSWKNFLQSGFPSVKHEEWRFTPLENSLKKIQKVSSADSDGMGTVYSELKNFQVIVNNTTGKEVGLKIIQ